MTVRLDSGREIVATRVFAAPRTRVFDAWTHPEQIGRWWGPRGFTTTTQSMDVRPGGTWSFVMHGPDGRDYVNRIAFLEVVRPERLSYRHVGDEGTEPVTFHVNVTFEEVDGNTRLTLRMVFASQEDRDHVMRTYKADEGAVQTLERLGEHLVTPGQVLKITRDFDAPRALVFRAWSDPQFMKRWWGPRGFTTPACKIDFRVGGKWHLCMRSPEGHDFWCGGVYREIVAPERIVTTDCFADADGNTVPASHYGMQDDGALEMIVTVILTEHEGKTRMTLIHAGLPTTPEGAGAETGWGQSFDKLAEELAKG